MKFSRPNFLAIGPEKTATSWLYSCLSLHNDIFMPPIKEVGYLWAKYFIEEQSSLPLVRSDHWYHAAGRRYCKQSLRKHASNLKQGKLDIAKLGWDAKYALFTHTDSWYCNLFTEHKTTGDVTPKYSELESAHITDIRSLFNVEKIIITLRDPIEREWSRAKMNACAKLGRDISDISHEEWLWNFDNGRQVIANEYAALYERWASIFGEKNVMIVYFDDVSEDSYNEINRVLRFLNETEFDQSFSAKLSNPVYKGISHPVPEKYQDYLYRKHKTSITTFATKFPDHRPPQKWLQKYQELYSQTGIKSTTIR